MKFVDMDRWDRREHFRYFQGVDYPKFDICAPVDVTKLLKYVKSRQLPFYHVMVYAATAAASSIVNFRYRIRNGLVIEHGRLHPSYTAMDRDSGLFKYVTVDMDGDLEEFIKNAREKEQTQKGLFGDEGDGERDDLVYLTCIPWVSFTSLSHTITLNKDDAIPRISWGKYTSDGGRTQMPLSVQVNHALADGFHIGQYFTALQEYMDQF